MFGSSITNIMSGKPHWCTGINLQMHMYAMKYRISSHVSRISRPENEPKSRRCDLYEGQNYNGSQWTSIHEYLAKIMGATYM